MPLPTSIPDDVNAPLQAPAPTKRKWGATKRLSPGFGDGPKVPKTPGAPAAPLDPVNNFDIMGRREKEADFQRNQLRTPGAGEKGAYNFVDANRGLATGAGPANKFFQDYQQQIGQDPGLGAYYDRAKSRTERDMNSQLAARGMAGSSFGAGMLGDALGGLEAERANREADYMLQQQQLGGGLAGQASKSMLDWTKGLGGLGLAGDQAGLARKGLAGQFAGMGDQGQLDRNRFLYDMMFGTAGQAAQGFSPYFSDQISGDKDLFESGQNIRLGKGAQGVENAEAAEARSDRQIGRITKTAGRFGGLT